MNDSLVSNIHSEKYFYYGSFNIYIYSASLFLLFKEIFKNKEESKLLQEMSKIYFGVYLIHGLVLVVLIKCGIFNININLSVKTIIISLIVFIISFMCSFIISKIPLRKRLIYVK